MANIFTYTFFIIGLFLIIKGGDIFVDSATQAAKMLKIPNFIIGATIVSIATTLPEIIVSIQATVTKSDITTSNSERRIEFGRTYPMAEASLFLSEIVKQIPQMIMEI